MGKITEEQQQIIEKFTCERLSCNPANKELIANFANHKNPLLAQYLQKYAWEEDLRSQTAYYLIKCPNNEIMLFFSLKCGALFDTLDERRIKERAQKFQELLQAIQEIDKEGHEREIVIQLLERYRSGQDISIEQTIRRVKMDSQSASNLLRRLNQDKQREGNEQIIRVGHTYPGIELVHFCSNDLAKNQWKTYEINHPMGEVLFWGFIAPIIDDIRQYVGCQYLYLFAADTSKDESLINYYDVALKFRKPTEIGTNKPHYDFCCQFMCEEISELKRNQQAYFDNFNPDADDVIA